MDLIMFLAANWDSVLVVIGFIALITILAKKGETKLLRQILFALVTQAEQECGDGTGKLKYAKVVDWVYQRIPAVLKFLFTAKDLEKMIEEVLEAAKESWSSNEKLLETGYIQSAVLVADTINPADGNKSGND